MGELDGLEERLSGIKISPTKKLDPPSENQQAASADAHIRTKPPTSIFMNKKLSSLAPPKKKALSTQNSIASKSKKGFDKDSFFNDSPMSVDDDRWGKNKDIFLKSKYNTLDQPKPAIIESPMKKNESTNYRDNITYASSGFSKYSKSDSPFKDPYSALNNNTIERNGANFLEKSDFFSKEKDVVKTLVQSIGDHDDKKEIEKLKEVIDEEDRKVKGLSVNLLDHQVHGLKFLRKREKSAVLHKGGLLCDDMGLGKTIQMIALIVKNKPKDKEITEFEDKIKDSTKERIGRVPYRFFKGTLVICPVSLTTQWISEIKRFAPHLKTFLYHGPNRPSSYLELIDYDVVVSSYDTIRSDHTKSFSSSPIYQGVWYRVVLDEAHNIKNRKAKSAEAVFQIESTRRWCLTGTPVQNSVDELQSLFVFLRVSSLSDPNEWKRRISARISMGDTKQALSTLRAELDTIMLRRTKAILQVTNFKLPDKNIHECKIEFTLKEQKLYDDLKNQITVKLSNDFFSDGDEDGIRREVKTKNIGTNGSGSLTKSHTNSYFQALVYLLRLRQLCCHWQLLTVRDDADDLKLSRGNGVKSANVSPSKSDSKVEEELDGLVDFMSTLTVQETKCSICLVNKVQEGKTMCIDCGKTIENHEKTQSAKFLKLIEILKKDRKRKTIVFSQFRQLLLILGPVLSSYGLKYVMYDGKMNLKKKDEALETLRNDQDTTVLLCSLKSGAVGLNLTVASQVIIFDPWWNPQIEEQAIDRVYRIGQTKIVDVYKFAVTDTVETGILALQEKKKKLAKAITDNDHSARSKLDTLSRSELAKLFGIHKQ